MSSAQMCGGEEAILLGFLLCKILVGTGFSSPQLAKASSTNSRCGSGKGWTVGFLGCLVIFF